jgi:hypothetical protein
MNVIKHTSLTGKCTLKTSEELILSHLNPFLPFIYPFHTTEQVSNALDFIWEVLSSNRSRDTVS